MNEQQILEQGNQAKIILDHPLFKKVIQDYENRLINEWKFSNEPHKLEREDIWLRYDTLKKVLTDLRIMFQTAIEIQHNNQQEEIDEEG